MVVVTRSHRRVLTAISVAGALVACGPGAATPLPEPPSIDVTRVSTGGEAMPLAGPAPVQLIGEVGATPARATVRVLNLDDTRPAVATTSGPDGTFALGILAAEGNELRLEARSGEATTAPVDVRVLRNLSGVAPVERPDCVAFEAPWLEVPTFGVQRLDVTNECTGELRIEAVSLRLGSAGFAVEAFAPETLEPGQASSIAVTFAADEAQAEDVLFVSVSVDGQLVRYPISLRVQ